MVAPPKSPEGSGRVQGRCQTLHYSIPRKARIDEVADTFGIGRATIPFISERLKQEEARKYLCFETLKAGFPSREPDAYPGGGDQCRQTGERYACGRYNSVIFDTVPKFKFRHTKNTETYN